LYYATGHYRNGVLLAPLTAALVKDLVMGTSDDPALAVVAPSRFGAL
jgi:glycine/D-amino acid oxidase-like deaminating enzyme